MIATLLAHAADRVHVHEYTVAALLVVALVASLPAFLRRKSSSRRR